MATELDALRELCERQVQLEHVSGLASLLAFNSGMAASLKEVLANRDAALLGYETAGAALESRQAERVRVEEAAGKQPEAPPPRRTGVLGLWDDLTAVDSEAGAKAAAAEEEARAAVAAAKERHLKISDRIHVEAEAFHTSTNEDFAAGAGPRMAPLHSPLSASHIPHPHHPPTQASASTSRGSSPSRRRSSATGGRCSRPSRGWRARRARRRGSASDLRGESDEERERA